MHKSTESDCDYLKLEYQRKSNLLIAKELKRSESAIKSKARKLGLRKDSSQKILDELKDIGINIIDTEEDSDGKMSFICPCGNKWSAKSYNIKKNKTTRCPKCVYKRLGKGKRSGTKHVNQRLFKSVKGHLNRRNGRILDIDIDLQFLETLLIKQKFKCAISNLSIYAGYDKEITASVDRIDSKLGYLKENVQWIHKDVNKMKWDFDQEYFIDMCTRISNSAK
jgi:DNA-directed RNA polymerase subunit RPC12/RpoP